MYFKEKEDTNIDSEFESKRKFSFNLNKLKLKPILFIVGGIVLLIAIISIIMSFNKKSSKYTLELMGEETITIKLGNDYIEPGYKAYDKKHNDCTDKVAINSTVDITKVGEYEVRYSINNISKVRHVIVTEKVTETYIHLKGNKEMYLEIGEEYIEPGYEVYDSLGETLTNKVKVTGSVNPNKLGTYELIYSVVNSKNVTITTKRRVTVVEKR